MSDSLWKVERTLSGDVLVQVEEDESGRPSFGIFSYNENEVKKLLKWAYERGWYDAGIAKEGE